MTASVSHQWEMTLSFISSETDRPDVVDAGGQFTFPPGTSREQAREQVKRLLVESLPQVDRRFVPNVLEFSLDPDLP